MKFEKNPHGTNEILEGDGFFISYNPRPWSGFSIFKSDNNSDETALVKEDDPDNKYRILNGDFRKEYKRLAPLGFKACLDFYNEIKTKHDSSWSTHHLS